MVPPIQFAPLSGLPERPAAFAKPLGILLALHAQDCPRQGVEPLLSYIVLTLYADTVFVSLNA
jgi:hypothetical protein